MNVTPFRNIVIIVLCFAAAALLGEEKLQEFFSSNPYLNGFIVAIMMVGVLYIVNASYKLGRVIALLKKASKSGADYQAVLKTKSARRKLCFLMAEKEIDAVANWSPGQPFGAEIVDDILSGVRLRIAEVRNFANYFSGVLIILGLLGTFLGLLETIKAIAEVFSGPSLRFLVGDKEGGGAAGGEEVLAFFDAIAKPLAGMGIAFSSSLFGLSGSLSVGVLAFASSRSQAFFLFALFDWLRSKTKEEDRTLLDRGKEALMPLRSGGLMGSLVSRGNQRSDVRSLGGGAGGQGSVVGSVKGSFDGTGQFTGSLDGNELGEVLSRLESVSRDAVEKNALLAQAALKLGENLALEQKRLADIANYQQQSSVALSAIQQQGGQHIQILNQLVEAAYSNTDREEFRALASHFHRSFEQLLGDIRQSNTQLFNELKRSEVASQHPKNQPEAQQPSDQTIKSIGDSDYTASIQAQRFESEQDDRK